MYISVLDWWLLPEWKRKPCESVRIPRQERDLCVRSVIWCSQYSSHGLSFVHTSALSYISKASVSGAQKDDLNMISDDLKPIHGLYFCCMLSCIFQQAVPGHREWTSSPRNLFRRGDKTHLAVWWGRLATWLQDNVWHMAALTAGT